MRKNKGMSKVVLIIIIALVVLLIAAVAVGVVLVVKKNNEKPVEVYEEPVDIYSDTIEFIETKADDSEEDELEPLDNYLTEFRNDEYGVRFGYPNDMETPVDSIDTDNFFHSIITKKDSKKTIELFIGNIDNLASSDDYIATRTEELKVDAKNNEVNITYGLLGEQMAIKLEYIALIKTEIEVEKVIDGRKQMVTETQIDEEYRYEIIAIKDKTAYGLIYSSEKDEYSKDEAEKVFNSFSFITSYMDYPYTSAREVVIEGEKYSLPVKLSQIKKLSASPKYSNEKLDSNYFSVISLYGSNENSYSAYIYNASASTTAINNGYLLGIETDKFKGGNIEIYGGVKIGTTYSEVRNILGEPKNETVNADSTEVINTYVIDDATIELRYKNSDGSVVTTSTGVYGISIRFKR